MNSSAVSYEDSQVEHLYCQLDQVRLHYAQMGPTDGPLVILLHGFPEFWYSWRHQLPALAAAGYRVVAPDMRGYGLSDKPAGVHNYRVETLTSDIAQLVDILGRERATIIGHDWGGFVAWWFGMLFPEKLDKLVVMNCPHPGHSTAMMTSLRQVRKSWYMLFFQLPKLPERSLKAREYLWIRRLFRRDPERKDAFTEQDIDRYVKAFQGEAPTAMINYYRALLRRGPLELKRQLRPIDAPTQVIWGGRDKHLGMEFAEPPAKWVWDLRMDIIDDASHWVQVDRPQRVNELLLEFL